MIKIRAHGEGTVNPDGYLIITLPDGRRIKEHRYVMEQHLGRTLLADEVVHHKDGNPRNNDLSNLELLTQSVHVKKTPKALRALAEGRKHRWSNQRGA